MKLLIEITAIVGFIYELIHGLKNEIDKRK